MRGWLLALALCLGAAGPAAQALTEAEILSFDALEGWAEDDHAAALAVFNDTCPDLRDPEWAAVCAFATSRPDARAFFETFFRPVLIGGPAPALFTGYFEPELRASPRQTAFHRHPVYALPPELRPGTPWLTRKQIDTGDTMAGRGLEIAWLRDPVDLYYLQIQGSGRLRLTDGRVLRLGYAGRNGHARQPISAELVRRGIYEPHQVSERVIRNWVRRHPEAGRDLLHSDPSYVFFRVLDDLRPDMGPRGAMNRPLTAGRSIAVDPTFTPLGAPVWVEKDGADPMRRLMVAQDTGGAIKGPQRADIFLGTGAQAGEDASVIRDPGRLIVLMPIEHAFAVAMGG